MEKRMHKPEKPDFRKPFHTVEPIIMDNAIMREQCLNEIPSDVNGSYTGTPADGGVPEQDADDL